MPITWNHAVGPAPYGKPLTLDDLDAARALVGPPFSADITVAPDVASALQKALPTVAVTGLRIYVDERLPSGAWHEGEPYGLSPSGAGVTARSAAHRR